MNSYRRTLAVCAALLLGMAAQAGWADDDDDECVEEFDVDWFIEINSTDGDAGAQLALDGEQWRKLEIEDPDGNEILDVKTKRSVRMQGLTEFFFETAEPSFEDQSLVEFLELFPEGEYEFEGKLRDGGEICGTAEFSHNLPGAPDTEAELDGDGNLVISWEEAEGAHPCLTPAATDAYRPHRSLAVTPNSPGAPYAALGSTSFSIMEPFLTSIDLSS